MGCLRRRRQPDRVARLPGHPRTERLGDGARRLGAAAPGARRTRRTPCRRRADVSEEPLLRRIRVRLGLGRRLRARRRALLPEAAVRGAVYAGAGAAAARRAGRAGRDARCTLSPAWSSWRERASCRHCTSIFPRARDFEAFGEAGFLPRIGQQFHWANDGYRDFDDYLAALNSGSARRSRRSGARRWKAASRSTC